MAQSVEIKAIREHKPELIAELQKREQAATTRGNFIRAVCKQLNERGVARFHSEKLGEVVYILTDYDDGLLKLPEGALVFTLQELQAMATQTYTDSELRELALAKREILAAQRQWLTERRKDLPAGVQAALRVFPSSEVKDIDEPPAAQEPPICYTCKGNDFWTQDRGGQVCQKCHPEPRTSER